MQAVILAAGEGYRLRPFTVNKPKVMVKVANKPILEYVVEALASAGVRDIVMVVGYRKNRVIDYFGDGKDWGVRIEYAVQSQQIGTAHALKQAEELVREETFLVLSGDNVIGAETVKALNRPWTVAYKVSEEPSKYGVLILEGNRIRKIVEKPSGLVSNLINVGAYHFGKEIFEWIGDRRDLVEVVNLMIENGYKFECVEAKVWMDVVYPWDILKVNDLAMGFSGKEVGGKIENVTIVGDVRVGKNSILRANSYIKGPCIVGENSEIGPNSVIMPATSIGDNVKVGAFCYIENCVIGDNVIIMPNCHLKDCVIDDGCVIKPNCTVISDYAEIVADGKLHRVRAGAFVGENCEIGASTVLKPGSIVGNNVRISELKVVDGAIPDSSVVL